MTHTAELAPIEPPPSVFERLERKLRAAAVPFEIQRHEPVFTSEDAARVRGTTLASGAKALICKVDERFAMFVVPADRKLASKGVRRELGIKSLRFATAEEVLTKTGLRPGSIPPFGSLFDLPTHCDVRLSEQPVINFNAGDHAISINIAFAAYQIVEQPQLGSFSE